MRRMKRLIIYPLRRSLGLPNNAHHDSIFVESRVLPLPYLLIYHSILLARRYIKQATTPHDAIQRHRDMFLPTSMSLLSTASDPMRYIATRCQLIPDAITSTCDSLLTASSKQIWNVVFRHFYHVWYMSQHPSNPIADPHSLFPCYLHLSKSNTNALPLYLSILSLVSTDPALINLFISDAASAQISAPHVRTPSQKRLNTLLCNALHMGNYAFNCFLILPTY